MKFLDFLNESTDNYELIYKQDNNGDSLTSIKQNFQEEIDGSSVKNSLKITSCVKNPRYKDEFILTIAGSKADLETLTKELDFFYSDYTISEK